jgi:hypothetical protein
MSMISLIETLPTIIIARTGHLNRATQRLCLSLPLPDPHQYELVEKEAPRHSRRMDGSSKELGSKSGATHADSDVIGLSSAWWSTASRSLRRFPIKKAKRPAFGATTFHRVFQWCSSPELVSIYPTKSVGRRRRWTCLLLHHDSMEQVDVR